MPAQTECATRTEKAAGEQDKAGRRNGSRLLLLWALVSGLWTIATVTRIDRLSASRVGWRKVVDGPWLWLGLILPPVMFACVLAAIYRIKQGRK